MIVDSNQVIIDKINVWKSKADSFFAVGEYINTAKSQMPYILSNDFSIFNKLEDEIKLLPNNEFLHNALLEWVREIEENIKANIKTGSKTLTALFQSYRIKLKSIILEIKSKLPIEIKSEAESPFNENEIKNTNNFQPKSGLDEVIYGDYISQFSKIEKELTSRGYLSDQYIWLENKTKFCEFLVVILDFKYTMSRISDLKVRHFFENRYGKGEGYLSEMFKPVKRPKFKTAEITFGFISSPEKSS